MIRALENYETLQKVINYYSSLEERFDLFFSVEKGIFVTGSIKHVYKALEQLKNEFKIISENQLFLDAGSGDGRICIIASLLGLQSYGIEYHPEITNSSILNITNLEAKGLFQNGFKIPSIIQGDFFDDSAYEKLGIKFGEFNIIFNFVTYHENLTQKIVKESPKGTIFILHSPCPINFSPEGMELVREIPLNGIFQILYVYKKI